MIERSFSKPYPRSVVELRRDIIKIDGTDFDGIILLTEEIAQSIFHQGRTPTLEELAELSEAVQALGLRHGRRALLALCDALRPDKARPVSEEIEKVLRAMTLNSFIEMLVQLKLSNNESNASAKR